MVEIRAIANIILTPAIADNVKAQFKNGNDKEIMDFIITYSEYICFMRNKLRGEFYVLSNGRIQRGHLEDLPFGGEWTCLIGRSPFDIGLHDLMWLEESRSLRVFKTNFGRSPNGWVQMRCGPDLIVVTFENGFVIKDPESLEVIQILAEISAKKSDSP